MSYLKDAFERMALRQIRQFLLYGTEELETDTRPYKDRLKDGCDPIYDRMKEMYPNNVERDRAAADLSEALTAYESAYMELGMKAGARLVYQLLLTEDNVPAEKK